MAQVKLSINPFSSPIVQVGGISVMISAPYTDTSVTLTVGGTNMNIQTVPSPGIQYGNVSGLSGGQNVTLNLGSKQSININGKSVTIKLEKAGKEYISQVPGQQFPYYILDIS